MRGKQLGALGTLGGNEINWAGVPDVQMRGGDGGALSGRPIGQEYDGLESGELAWIMGRKFITKEMDGSSLEDRAIPFQAISQSAHGLGMGYGPDRMQRLAYTSWMEAYFRAVFGRRAIVLNNIPLAGAKQTYLSSELSHYSNFIAGGSVVNSVDLPHVLNGIDSGKPALLAYSAANGDSVPVAEEKDALKGLASGLHVVEKGPFLRGKIVNDDPVDMIALGLKTANRGLDIEHTVPRNMGDRLAFDALYSEMRAQNFFDWSPDGMVLSKLESPSGEPMSSAELDARQAQLFNVCIQGPAIAKTWTGDSRMQCMPLDKVFVVMVADISSVKGGAAATGPTDYWKEYGEYLAKLAKNDSSATLPPAPTNTMGTVAAPPYAAAVENLFERQAAVANAGTPAAVRTATDELAAARNTLDDFFGPLEEDYDTEVAAACKQGTADFESVMTNFRLMRVTSSYLSATSGVTIDSGTKKVDPKSRCGLRLGQSENNNTVTGEYIIGGWCIGTVIDSAASRSSIGNMVRTAPASMAININVNVEWWSGDELHRRYMDVNSTVQQRGQVVVNTEAVKRFQGLDVSLADLEEAVSWVARGQTPPVAVGGVNAGDDAGDDDGDDDGEAT